MPKKNADTAARLPRGHFAKKLGLRSDVRYALVKIDDEVWDAFGGDKAAIEGALADAVTTLARLVTTARAAKKSRAKSASSKKSSAA